jgi:hypothetical protein
MRLLVDMGRSEVVTVVSGELRWVSGAGDRLSRLVDCQIRYGVLCRSGRVACLTTAALGSLSWSDVIDANIGGRTRDSDMKDTIRFFLGFSSIARSAS